MASAARDRSGQEIDESLEDIPGLDPENMEDADLDAESLPQNGDIRDDAGAPDEDDDNPFQESDEILPDESEERVLLRNPGLDERRFDDV